MTTYTLYDFFTQEEITTLREGKDPKAVAAIIVPLVNKLATGIALNSGPDPIALADRLGAVCGFLSVQATLAHNQFLTQNTVPEEPAPAPEERTH